MSCLIVGQTATVREQLCNYLQPEFSTVYHADVRPSPALTMERLADSGVRKLTRPVTTSAFPGTDSHGRLGFITFYVYVHSL